MAEHGTTVRGIDYKTTFPFTNLFRGFRLAIDPSKIMLALAALLLLYVGGQLLDVIWPEHAKALPNELQSYTANSDDFGHTRDEMLQERDEGLKAFSGRYGLADAPPSYAALVHAIKKQRDDQLRALDASATPPAPTANPLAAPAANPLGDATTPAPPARDAARHEIYANYAGQLAVAKSFATQGLFNHFLTYEVQQVNTIVWSAVNLQIPAVIDGLKNFFIVAPAWAFRHHPVFSILFFAWLLVIWSIFGGAIARIAAVQVARDEKISVRGALKFSSEKILSFIFAPLIPIIIIAVIGLIVAVFSLLISVPGIGGIWSVLVGILFFAALLAGLVMMLTAIGLIGGGNLMFPTIAAEGSDSFDAVSRSFSYLYARPWQLLFYSLVSLIYGAITYIFVRLALFVLLLLVHGSANAFQWGHALDGSPVFDAMWPQPGNLINLSYDPNYAVLGPVQSTGAAIISFWVFLATTLLGAYAISLYVSSSTLIYFLMRREVDATEMDEVFLEPTDEELTDTTIVPESSETAPKAVEPQGQPVDLPVPPIEPPTAF